MHIARQTQLQHPSAPLVCSACCMLAVWRERSNRFAPCQRAGQSWRPWSLAACPPRVWPAAWCSTRCQRSPGHQSPWRPAAAVGKGIGLPGLWKQRHVPAVGTVKCVPYTMTPAHFTGGQLQRLEGASHSNGGQQECTLKLDTNACTELRVRQQRHCIPPHAELQACCFLRHSDRC